MTEAVEIARMLSREEVGFLLSNRLPRQLATRLMGWYSRIEQPLLARASIGLWRLFADLDLSDSRLERFDSVRACFTRELKPGARPIDRDPAVLTSPCDGIVGACGRVRGDELMQVKGFTYTLSELLTDARRAARYVDGAFVTLRLTPTMYHRFHAPYDCAVERVVYVGGDTFNVNPAALKRVAKLFCKNERTVIETVLGESAAVVTLVAVAAILVASIRLHCIGAQLDMDYRGAAEIPCRAAYGKGDEMGWFEHGSTIIVLAPKGFALCDGVREGTAIRMGRPLMRMPGGAD